MPDAPLPRVIYVDDEPHIRTLVQVSLERIGHFTTCICASGEEALRVAADFRPDLILLDVMMPDLDGPGTLARLRRLPDLAHVPIVFLTAKANSDERQRLVDLGAIEVITKPFAPLELPKRIQAIWSRATEEAAGGTRSPPHAA